MENPGQCLRKELFTFTCAVLIGCVTSAATYQENEDVAALMSRVEGCCGSLQDLRLELQECRRVLDRDDSERMKRTAIEDLVQDFNEERDWKALSAGLEELLDVEDPARQQLASLGAEETAPLAQIVDAEHVALLRVLLNHGLAVNMATSEDERQTMLHLAAMHGKLSVARLLVTRGADVHATNRYSNPPLVEAVASNELPVVRLLASHGADVNSPGGSGRTALHTATLHSHLPVAEYLVEAGADVDARDRWGQTSLHLAAFEGRLPTAELLLQQGADVAARDEDGVTPLHLAAFGGHLEVARLLVEAGADPDTADLHGWTSLHKAAFSGHLPVVKYLVASGASTRRRDHANNTALNLAVIEDHTEVMEFLSSSRQQAWVIINPDED